MIIFCLFHRKLSNLKFQQSEINEQFLMHHQTILKLYEI